MFKPGVNIKDFDANNQYPSLYFLITKEEGGFVKFKASKVLYLYVKL